MISRFQITSNDQKIINVQIRAATLDDADFVLKSRVDLAYLENYVDSSVGSPEELMQIENAIKKGGEIWIAEALAGENEEPS